MCVGIKCLTCGVPYDALHDLRNLDMANIRRIIENEKTQVDEGAFMLEVKAHYGDSFWGIFPFATKGIFFINSTKCSPFNFEFKLWCFFFQVFIFIIKMLLYNIIWKNNLIK
jgi:hypothetical protein